MSLGYYKINVSIVWFLSPHFPPYARRATTERVFRTHWQMAQMGCLVHLWPHQFMSMLSIRRSLPHLFQPAAHLSADHNHPVHPFATSTRHKHKMTLQGRPKYDKKIELWTRFT